MNETADAGTAAALVHAAARLFARYGYDGASVRQITAAAGANLGAITYHFGSKSELYNRVVATCAEPLMAAVERAVRQPGPVLDRLGGVVRAYFEIMSSDDVRGRIMVQAIVIGQETPAVAIEAIKRIHGSLHALVVEGQKRGELRDGDPRLLSLSVISVPLHLVLVRRMLKQQVGVDLDDPEQREAAIAHAVRFVREALAAHQPDDGVE